MVNKPYSKPNPTFKSFSFNVMFAMTEPSTHSFDYKMMIWFIVKVGIYVYTSTDYTVQRTIQSIVFIDRSINKAAFSASW